VGWPDRHVPPRSVPRPSRLARVAVIVVALAAVVAPAVTAWGQEGPADPAVVRQDVRDVMSRPEFSYEPSIMERIGDWLSDFLDDLFPDVPVGAGGGFAGGVGPLVAWALIAAAVAAAVLAVVVVIRTRVPRSEEETPASAAEIEHRRTAADWQSDAERFEAAGRWKDALRARYRNLVRTLVDHRQLPDVPGRTTGELRADLRRSTPGAADPFDGASLLFELAWYADVATGPDENRRFRAAAQQVLSASAEDRFDPAAVLLDVSGAPDDGGVVEVGR